MKRSISDILLTFIMIAAIVVGYFYSRHKYDVEDKLLNKGAVQTFATMKTIYKGTAVRSSSWGVYVYYVNGKRIEKKETGDFNKLRLGDTILIEYAKVDHTVSRVVNRYYMKKYKHLKKVTF